MGHETVLTVFVVIAALAFVVQAVLVLCLYLALRGIPARIDGIRADVKQRLDPLVESVTEILTASREPVRTITVNLAEISRILRERAGLVDALLADLADKSRLQIIRVDQFVTALVDKIENTTETLRQQVLTSIHEVSAVIRGVRSGLDFLFSRHRVSSVTEATQDEQMFI